MTAWRSEAWLCVCGCGGGGGLQYLAGVQGVYK